MGDQQERLTVDEQQRLWMHGEPMLLEDVYVEARETSSDG